MIVGLGSLLGIRALRPPESAPAVAADTAITSGSIAYFEQRLAQDPGNYMVAGRLINRYILRFGTGARMDDVARAEALARGLVRTGPERGQALTRLSSVLLMQHKFAEALETASEAAHLRPWDQDALGTVFDAALAAGRYAMADSILTQLRPAEIGTVVRHAQWEDARGRSEVGYATLRGVCERFDHTSSRPQVTAWCLTQLGAMEHSRTGPEAATELWRRALRALPGYRGAIEGLANLAAARGDWPRAEQLYRRIAADAHPDLYLRLSEVEAALGRAEPARRYEHQFLAVAGRPENEPLFGLVLAGYYADRGTPAALDTALALAVRDLARRPTVESFDELAWVHFRRGEYVAALEASDQAQSWGAPSPTMAYHRSRILERLGRIEESTRLLQDALSRRTLLAPHVLREIRAAAPRLAAAG